MLTNDEVKAALGEIALCCMTKNYPMIFSVKLEEKYSSGSVGEKSALIAAVVEWAEKAENFWGEDFTQDLIKALKKLIKENGNETF